MLGARGDRVERVVVLLLGQVVAADELSRFAREAPNLLHHTRLAALNLVLGDGGGRHPQPLGRVGSPRDGGLLANLGGASVGAQELAEVVTQLVPRLRRRIGAALHRDGDAALYPTLARAGEPARKL